MATEDTLILLAAPAIAYREYLYRPHGQLARWISERFETVAGPGQRVGQTLHEGDVLIEVTIGRMSQGRCATLASGDVELLASRRRLAAGQLVLRARKRIDMSEPLPVEPAVDGLPSWNTVAAGTAPPATGTVGTVDDLMADHDYGDDDPATGTGVTANTAAAVASFDPAERVAVVERLADGEAGALSEAEALLSFGDVKGDSADTTVGYDQALVDPDYNADSGEEPSEVWSYAQKIRELLETRGSPFANDRVALANAVLQQLQTLGLYREVKLARAATQSSGKRQPLTLYVLLFPGEGRDNTGIKDLNDKVLGYKVNSGFIKKRQMAIRDFFWAVEDVGPRYVTVGQDYKTAAIVAHEKKREDFAADLVQFDARLRQGLLDSLDEAEKDPIDDKQVAEIKKLRKVLLNDKKYKFDFLFGTASIDPSTQRGEIDATFLLLTQALKGAGIARFVSKAVTQKSKEARKISSETGVKADKKALDVRGKAFDLNAYRKTTNAAEKINTFMTTPYNRDRPYDYINILVDAVWDYAFLYHRKIWLGNPDVIRDVRKKLLVAPTMKQGVKYTFRAQVELLELWLVALNELDFVKDFLPTEFSRQLVAYHELCYQAFRQLHVGDPIDWDRLTKVLTRDLRLTERPVLVQGTTSEYAFYAYSADHSQQIFFTMDVRDLGVEVIQWYELSNVIILEDKLSDYRLMDETFESTKPINQRKRATYDAVVAVMNKYFAQLQKGDCRTAARKAFETGVQTRGLPSDFDKGVRVMLGGDEVFVAAHPYFACYVSKIISDLDKTTFKSDSHGQDLGERPLNMRVSVSYSSARITTGDKRTTSSGLSPAQRLENQRSHDRALRLGGSAANALKTLERTQRRIERLIDLMKANEKKAKRAPEFTDRLTKLNLLHHFIQVQYAHTAQLSQARYEELLATLDAGNLVKAAGMKLVDLVDYDGNLVNAKKLTTDMAKLEADVVQVVGWDNYHQDGPPVDPLAKKIGDLLKPKKDKDKTL